VFFFIQAAVAIITMAVDDDDALDFSHFCVEWPGRTA
jgi:hypothetical protein